VRTTRPSARTALRPPCRTSQSLTQCKPSNQSMVQLLCFHQRFSASCEPPACLHQVHNRHLHHPLSSPQPPQQSVRSQLCGAAHHSGTAGATRDLRFPGLSSEHTLIVPCGADPDPPPHCPLPRLIMLTWHAPPPAQANFSVVAEDYGDVLKTRLSGDIGSEVPLALSSERMPLPS